LPVICLIIYIHKTKIMKRLIIIFTIFTISTIAIVLTTKVTTSSLVHCSLNPANLHSSFLSGPVYSWFNYNKSPMAYTKNHTGSAIALREEYNITPNFSLGMEGEFVHNSYCFESKYDAKGYNSNVADAFRHNLSTNMINVPVFMKLYIPHSEKLKYYVSGGLGLSYMVGGSREVDQVLPVENGGIGITKTSLSMPAQGAVAPANGYYTLGLGGEIKLCPKSSLLIELKSRNEMGYRNYQNVTEQEGGYASSFGIMAHSWSLGAGLKF
jgi:hypothetical protein